MIHAERAAQRITLEIEHRDRDVVTTLPGARWDPESDRWSLPLTWAAYCQLWGVWRERLRVGPDLTAWAGAEYETRVNPCRELRTALEASGDERLFRYQRAGVRFLQTARQALLADEMGTGKTIQAIVALSELGADALPALVICPNSMKRVWERELHTWAPHLTVSVVAGAAKKRTAALTAPADVYVINWESLRMHTRLAPYGSTRLSDAERKPGELNELPLRTVIADEAHRIKSPQAKQTRAAWFVGHQPSVLNRWALTGTPIANALDDLWSVMHFVSPDEYPVRGAFIDRYALLGWAVFGGINVIGIQAQTRDELFAFLDPRMRRMTKEVVLPFLPEKVRHVRYAELSPKQRKAYDQMKKQMIAELGDGSQVVSTTQLVKMTRLVQFSSAYAEVDDTGHLILSEPSSKLDVLMDLLEEDLKGRQVVVAAVSAQLVDLACKRLDKAKISYRRLTGSTPEAERAQGIADFQAGNAQVFIFTVQAGGVGITLTAADTIVFLQRSWSMIDNRQAEDRVHRIGSERHESVNIIDIVADGTVEEYQVRAVAEKGRRMEEVVRDRDLLQRLLRDSDLQEEV